jgi:hypothetical protein
MIGYLRARTAKKTPRFTVTKINRLTLFKEIIAVYGENHMKHINTNWRVIVCWIGWDIWLPLGFQRVLNGLKWSRNRSDMLKPMSCSFRAHKMTWYLIAIACCAVRVTSNWPAVALPADFLLVHNSDEPVSQKLDLVPAHVRMEHFSKLLGPQRIYSERNTWSSENRRIKPVTTGHEVAFCCVYCINILR